MDSDFLLLYLGIETKTCDLGVPAFSLDEGKNWHAIITDYQTGKTIIVNEMEFILD